MRSSPTSFFLFAVPFTLFKELSIYPDSSSPFVPSVRHTKSKTKIETPANTHIHTSRPPRPPRAPHAPQPWRSPPAARLGHVQGGRARDPDGDQLAAERARRVRAVRVRRHRGDSGARVAGRGRGAECEVGGVAERGFERVVDVEACGEGLGGGGSGALG